MGILERLNKSQPCCSPIPQRQDCGCRRGRKDRSWGSWGRDYLGRRLSSSLLFVVFSQFIPVLTFRLQAQPSTPPESPGSVPIKPAGDRPPSTVPPTLQRLLQGPRQPTSSLNPRPSQTGLSIPSLWWIDQQFGQKTVLDWIVYPNSIRQDQQVHVYLRSNLWARFSYLERYAFVTHFGHLTRTYGYQLVMLESTGLPLASYICDFVPIDPLPVPGTQDAEQSPIFAYTLEQQPQLDCEMWLNPTFPRQVF